MIDIIIPVYNVSDKIGRCIHSLLNQSYKNFSIIFVNDKTQDNSVQIIQNLLNGSVIKYVIIEHSINKGLSAARNSGLLYSNADYILFVDSDDEITPDALKILSSFIYEYDIIMGSTKTQSNDFYCLNQDLKLKDESSVQNAFFQNKIFESAWNKLIERNFLIKNNIFFEEGRIHEDILWNFKCCMAAKRVRLIQSVTYIYYLNSIGSITYKFGTKNKNDMIHAYQSINSLIYKESIPKVPLEFANRFLIKLSFDLHLRFILNQVTIKLTNDDLKKLKVKSDSNIFTLKKDGIKKIFINYFSLRIKTLLVKIFYK